MDDKILTPKEEFEKLEPSFDQLSEERNLRKQAEEKLKSIQAELIDRNRELEQLRLVKGSQDAILNNAAYMVISAGCDGIITTFNPAAECNLGYTAEECIGKLSPVVFHDPDELAKRATIFSAELGVPVAPDFEVFALRARLRLPNEYEWTYVRKDGSRFPVLLSVTVLWDPQGNTIGFMGIANDITGRKQSEAMLFESEAKFSTVFQLSPVALSITSLKNQLFIDVNESFLRNVGYTREELVGQPANVLDLWVDHERWDNFRQLMAGQGKVDNYEFEFQDKKGKRGYGLVSATVIEINNEPCILSQITSITERKAMEEALKRSEARLNEAQHIAHIGSWELDIVNNRLMWSDEIYRIFGIDPKNFDASYEAFLNAIHPDDRDLVNKAYTDSLKNKVPYNIVHRLQMPDGKIKYVNEKCETYYDNNDKPLRSVGTVHDITGIKLAEEAQQRLNRELQAISNCNQVLMRAVDEQTLLFDICQIICNEAGYRMAWVGFAEHDQIMSVRAVAHAGAENGYLETANIVWADEELGHGPSGVAIRTGESACFQDFATDAEAAPWRESALQRGYRSSIALPLKDENAKVFGVLNIYSTESNAFTPEEIRLLEELAGDLSFGITVLRGRIESKLSEQKIMQLAAIVESSDDAITGKTLGGIVTSWNKGAENLYGYSEDEMIGKSISILLHPESEDEVPMILEKIKAGEHIEHFETLRQRKDGQLIHVSLTISPVLDEHGIIIGASTIGRDITERKQAEDERKTHVWFMESLDRINMAIQGANDLEQMMSDVLEETLSIFDCDRASLVYPCDPDSPTWQVPMERFKPAYPGVFALGVEMPMTPEVAQAHRKSLQSDYSLAFGAGTDLPISRQMQEFGDKSGLGMAIRPKIGKPWGFTLIQCSDIRQWSDVERRLFEEIGRRVSDALTGLLAHRDLQESEERYRMVFENSPVSIWEEDFSGVKTFFDDLKKEGVTDIETYFDRHPETIRKCADLAKIIDVNHAASALHEASNKEELFAGLSKTFTQESFETFRKELVCIWNGGTGMTIDATVKTIKGEHRDVTVYFSVCPGHEETLSKVLVSLTDITKRKQMEAALRESEEKYRTLIQKIQTAVVVHGADTQITTCNAKAQELLGLTEDQLLGKTAIDPEWHFYQEDGTIMPLEEYPVNRVVATRQVLRNYILGAHRPNNDNDVWVLVNADPIFGKLGEISQVIVTFIDITDRKQAEEALRQSEWRYREIFDNVLDSLFLLEITSDKRFRNLEINPAFEKSTGIPRAQLIGKFIEETVPAEVASIVNAKYRHCVEAAHPIEEEAELDLPTGRHYFHSTLIPARDEAGHIYRIIGISRDITERKNAEEELEKYRDHLEALVAERTKQLQENEFYYRRLFETMFQGVVYQDAMGKVISMNPAAELILGITQSESSGKIPVETENQMFREDGSRFPAEEHPAMVALSTGQEVRDVVMKLYNPKKEKYRWININAMPLFHQGETKPYQVYTLFSDITEHKAAEEILRESEERMRLFFERQLVGMAITSTDKGWIKVNDKICEMLGYPSEELTQMTWSEMTYPEDLAPDMLQFERLLRDEIDGYTLEKRFVRKDGSIVFTNLAVGCVRRPDRSVDYVLAILEDITGRKLAEDQIRRLNEQLAARALSLEQANKELEAFSYSVSHDLRAPLRGIDGFSMALLDEYNDKLDEQGKLYLSRVRSASQRMAQLIDDMLNLSRVSRGEMNIMKVNLSKLAYEIAEEFQETQPERKAEFIIQEGIEVHGDGHLLRIVLENLIGNSWKFTSKHVTARIEFGMLLKNGRPVYFVRDDGAGFDMNYAQKLFGAFQRLHTVTEFQGTGVGLATVQRVVLRHGGKVWAESGVEKGTTIYFTIA